MQNEEQPVHEALDHLREAERELAQARQAEKVAEDLVEVAIDELKLAEVEEARESEIIVNGRRRSVEGRIVDFEEVVKLAFPTGPTKANTRFTVTYRNAAQVPAAAEMDPGQRVKVKPGRNPKNETIFNVTETVLS